MLRSATAPTIPHMIVYPFVIFASCPAASSPAIVTCLRARHASAAPARRVLADRRCPPPIVAPRRPSTGATSTQFEPMKHVVLDHRAVLVRAVVVAGDRAGADVDAARRRRVADVGEVVGLASPRRPARLHLDEVADVHVVGERAPGRSRAYGPMRALRADRRAVEMRDTASMRVPAPTVDVAQHAVRPDRAPVAERHRPSNTQPTSMSTSRPQRSVAAHVEARRDRRASRRAHQRVGAARAARCARRAASCARSLTPSTSSLVGRSCAVDRHAVRAAPARRCRSGSTRPARCRRRSASPPSGEQRAGRGHARRC